MEGLASDETRRDGFVNDARCLVCGGSLEEGGGPYSVCYDGPWRVNVWGGDTHEYIGHLCRTCGDRMVRSVGFESDTIEVPAHTRPEGT